LIPNQSIPINRETEKFFILLYAVALRLFLAKLGFPATRAFSIKLP
jgi:hypothetical protein